MSKSHLPVFYQYEEKRIWVSKIQKNYRYRFEFHAGSENSKHLAGVKSPKGTKVFFNRCLDETALLTRDELFLMTI